MDETTRAPPLAPVLQADQFPVSGDEVWIRAEFHSLHHGGCFVKIKAPNNMAQHLVVDGLEVFAQLQVGHVLKTYGQ